MRKGTRTRARTVQRGWRVELVQPDGRTGTLGVASNADRAGVWAGALRQLPPMVMVSLWHGDRCVCMAVSDAGVVRLPMEKQRTGRACPGGLTWGDDDLRPPSIMAVTD